MSAAFILRVQGWRLTQSGRTSEEPTHRGNRRHGSTLRYAPKKYLPYSSQKSGADYDCADRRRRFRVTAAGKP